MLANVTGSVDQLLRNEYLTAENRIFQRQVQGRLRLTDDERRTLAEIGGCQLALHQQTHPNSQESV